MSSSAKEYQLKRERERREFDIATRPVKTELRSLLQLMLDGHRYLVKNLIRIETGRDFSSTTQDYLKCLDELGRLSLSLNELPAGSKSNAETSGAEESGHLNGTIQKNGPLYRKPAIPSPFSIFQDEKSQWKDMKPLHVSHVTEQSWSTNDWAVDQRKWPMGKEKDHSALPALVKGTFVVTTFGKRKPGHSKPSASDHKVIVPGKNIPAADYVQKYSDYIILKSNIITEDDDNMRYVPYFGEDIDAVAQQDFQEELKEAYVDKTIKNELDAKRAEKAAQFSILIGDLLENCDITTSDIKHYLLGKLPSDWSEERKRMREKALPAEFDLTMDRKTLLDSLRPITGDKLERAEAVSHAFRSVTKLSIWDVLKKYDKDDIAPIATSPVKQVQSSQILDAAPFSLDSYQMLKCSFCGLHECPWHDYKLPQPLPINESVQPARKPGTVKTAAPADQSGGLPSPERDISREPEAPVEKSLPVVSQPLITPQQRVFLERISEDCFERDVPCSETCFTTVQSDFGQDNGDGNLIWTEDQVALFHSSAIHFRNNSRCACLLACVIHLPCFEIYAKLQREELLPEVNLNDLTLSAQLIENGILVNGVRQNSALSKKQKSGYPQDCDQSPIHNKRPQFKPCNHPGKPCSLATKCSCAKTRVHCEKFCNCSPDCARRWRGCNCASGKLCGKGKCACYSANRECDPDLCRKCGADEQLDPVNRLNDQITENCCQNVPMQKGIPLKTLLGKTILPVNGYGLFTGHAVKRDTFLGEYKGEVISNDEAERRGKLYDKRRVSFLFNLNAAQVIDATRAGNKFRFVNHWAKKPNTYARVFLVNGIHRIGMFAKKDIPAGEELFFDYGYNTKTIEFVQTEPVDPKAGSSMKAGGKRKKSAPGKASKAPLLSNSVNSSSVSVNEIPAVTNARSNKANLSRQNSASAAARSDSDLDSNSVARSRIRRDFPDDRDGSSRMSSDPSESADDYAIDKDDSADDDFADVKGPSFKRKKKKRRVD